MQNTYFGEKHTEQKTLAIVKAVLRGNFIVLKGCIKQEEREFPGGSVVETLCSNEGGKNLITG